MELAWEIDKSTWGPGPWVGEPDREEWRSSGLPCLVVRSGVTGALCGYVGVPPGHPWHGLDESEVETATEGGVGVHGGLTYSSYCMGPICHVPKDGEPEAVWWLGFDTAHYRDMCPAIDAKLRKYRGGDGHNDSDIYRDLAYVHAEVERLAARASRVAP